MEITLPAMFNKSLFIWLLLFMELDVDGLESEGEIILPPVLTSQPEDEYIVVLGQSVTLPCEASGYPNPTYYWLRDGQPIILSSTVTRTPGVGNLQISHMTEAEEGSYQCFVENMGGRTRTNPSPVRLAYLNRFSHQTPSVISNYVGYSMRLTCNPPEGLPAPAMSWDIQHEGQEMVLFKSTERIMKGLEGHLYITNLLEEDREVTFQCMARNDIMRNIVLGPSYKLRPKTDPRLDVMIEATKMWSSESSITVRAGEDARLQCIFAGSPTPVVMWERDDAALPVGRWFTLEGGTLLEIRGTQEEDSGTYTCMGYNDVSHDHLLITFTLAVIPNAPTLEVVPISQNVSQGDQVSFSCRSSDIPEPTYNWYVNGSRPINAYLENNVKLTAHSFTLPSVHWTDTMTITCEVSTVYGTTASSSAYLSVKRSAYPALYGHGIRKIPEYWIISFFISMIFLV